MLADAILDCSNRKAIVLDAFAGSGSTLLAAAQTGRCGAGIEIDPIYVDLITRRLQEEPRCTPHFEISGSEAVSERLCNEGVDDRISM